jgi:hypothetical protein
MQDWLAEHAASEPPVVPTNGRRLALVLAFGVFVSCALSWFAVTG